MNKLVVQVKYRYMPVLACLPLLYVHNLCKVVLAAISHFDQAAKDSLVKEGLIDPLLQLVTFHLQRLKLNIIGWNILIIFVLHKQHSQMTLVRQIF